MRAPRLGLTPLLAAAVLLAGCSSDLVSQATSIPLPTDSPTASPAASVSPSASPAPAGNPTRPPTTAPTRPPTAAPTAASTTAPTTAPTTGPTGGPLGTPGSVASCTGTAANRTFFANAAAAFTWDVYCAVLPKGWYVEAGSYKGASGGNLTVAYKTNAGLRLELKEGNYCSGTPATCGPTDSVIGAAAFGDREGQLGRLAGKLVLYVEPGSSPAWQATGTGLDEATFRSYLAALVKLPG